MWTGFRSSEIQDFYQVWIIFWAQLYGLNIRSPSKPTGGRKEGKQRQFLVIVRSRCRRNLKEGNIQEIGKRVACKWTNRSNVLKARTRHECACAYKMYIYIVLSGTCVRKHWLREHVFSLFFFLHVLLFSFMLVYEYVERRILGGERSSFPREAKLRGNWPAVPVVLSSLISKLREGDQPLFLKIQKESISFKLLRTLIALSRKMKLTIHYLYNISVSIHSKRKKNKIYYYTIKVEELSLNKLRPFP